MIAIIFAAFGLFAGGAVGLLLVHGLIATFVLGFLGAFVLGLLGATLDDLIRARTRNNVETFLTAVRLTLHVVCLGGGVALGLVFVGGWLGGLGGFVAGLVVLAAMFEMLKESLQLLRDAAEEVKS